MRTQPKWRPTIITTKTDMGSNQENKTEKAKTEAKSARQDHRDITTTAATSQNLTQFTYVTCDRDTTTYNFK